MVAQKPEQIAVNSNLNSFEAKVPERNFQLRSLRMKFLSVQGHCSAETELE